jgi:GntR family transcriptional regulator
MQRATLLYSSVLSMSPPAATALDTVLYLCILSIFIMHTGPSSIVLSQTGGPLYQQILDQIKQKIAVEEWKAGDEIPSIRQLAVDLRVSVITVKRAYLELEREGLIVTQHGKGSFVAPDVATGPHLYEQELSEHLEEAARLGVTIGMSGREIVSRLRKVLDEVDDSRPINPKSSRESQ